MEFSGWQKWEVVYVCICTAAITVISLYLGDNLLGVASAITGTLYTMFAGKGKISCYFFGIFNSAAYGYIAFENRLFGDAMLNWCWYLPMMIAGIIFWSRKTDAGGNVIKNVLSCRGRLITAGLAVSGIVLYAWLLTKMGDPQPVVDSATTVLSVVAMVLTVKRCAEQWLMWIIVNTISVIMWLRVFYQHGNSIATLLWWIIMLISGIIFFIQWMKGMKNIQDQR